MQEAVDEISAQNRRNELLILSSSSGFKIDVEELISEGADVNCVDKEGTPVLHFPSSKNHIEIVKFLVSKGAEIDAEDKTGQTALHFASQSNAQDVVKFLVRSGAWLDAYDKNDDTPLHLAIRAGHLETVKTLLMGSSRTEIMNNRHLTALGEAILQKNVHILQLLISKGADVHRVSNGYSMLHLAASVGSEEVVQILLKYIRPDSVVHPGGVTVLHSAAARNASPAVLRLLIDHGADPHIADANGKLPLDWAIESGNQNAEVLKLLSVGDRKKKSQRRTRSTPITEIEPADGPDGEWNTFQEMNYDEKLKQVEVWARSKEQFLNELPFLDEDSRKAIALVGNFMRMLECRAAIEKLKADETFQKDAIDPQVQKAITECTENPQNIRKFASNEKIMNVLIKLKRLQETLKRNGRMKLMYQELLQREVPDSGNEKMTTEELEKALKTAKEAVVKAVLGKSNLPKKDEGTTWWTSDASVNGEGNGENSRMGSTAFFKTLLFQFIRQFLLALTVFAIVAFALYFTDSLPAPSPRGPNGLRSTPAYITKDHRIHEEIARGEFRPEL